MIHPGKTFTIDVDHDDEETPDAEHRRFAFRYGSSAEYMEIDDMLEDVKKLSNRSVCQALSSRLAKGEDAERLANTTTPAEQVTILVKLEAMQTLSESMAKKSKPLSPSSRGSSAQDATPEATAVAAS